MHSAPVPVLFNNSTNTNIHLPSDYPEFDSQKSNAGKLNGLGNNNSYSREQFNNFPNTNRPRHQGGQSLLTSVAPPFREPGTFFPSTNSDIFTNTMMSPTSAPMQPHDPRMGYEFGRQGVGHKNFSDPYNGSVGVLPSHQGAGKQGFSQPQQGHNYPPFLNGMHSQTPYGPHVPANMGQPAPNQPTNNSTTTAYVSNKETSNNQEEISTIFVVGFPEDMQVS